MEITKNTLLNLFRSIATMVKGVNHNCELPKKESMSDFYKNFKGTF